MAETRKMKTNIALIQLTKRQKEIAEWAVDPMGDYFSELVGEGEMDKMPPLPQVYREIVNRGGNAHAISVLELPLDPNVIGDLLYRITIQFRDMIEDEQSGMVADTIVGVDGIERRNVEGIKAEIERAKNARADATSARQLGRKIASVAKQNRIEYFVG